MRSPALALAWQTMRRHRIGLAIVVGLAFAISILFQVLSGSIEKKHSYLCTFQFVFALIYVAAVFAYGFESALESGESCFPRRQFTLPVRTVQLVLLPMFLGTASVALIWTVWVQFVLRPAGVDIAIGPAALQAAAITAVLQALLWWPFGIPWARVIITVHLLPLLILTPILAGLLDVDGRTVTVFFFAVLVCSVVLALAGVARTRRGDVPRWRWLEQPIDKPRVVRKARPARPIRAFRSLRCALNWFEHRRHLLAFPLVVACAAILLLHGIFLFEEVHENQLRLGFNFLILPPLFAPFVALSLGRTGSSSKTANVLSAFTATRPVSTAALVGVKFRMALASALMACGVLVLLASIWFFGTGVYRQLPDWWRQVQVENQTLKVAASFLLVASMLLVITWRLLIDGICAALTGRTWIARANWLLHGLALTLGMMIVADVMNRPGDYQAGRDALSYALGAAVAIRIFIAACLIRILVRRQLGQPREIVVFGAIWLAVAALLFGLARFVVPNEIVGEWTLTCIVLLVLPMVRLCAAPLALAWNRHR